MENDIKFSLFDKKINFLGSGVSGEVELYKSYHHNRFYAIKVYHCKESYENFNEYKQRVQYEYNILKNLNHINVISVYKFTSPIINFNFNNFNNNNNVYLYLEYGGKPISKKIKTIKPSKCFCMFKQLINGVKYLHDQGIVHRDLKFDNFLINHNGILKIIDFMDSYKPSNAVEGECFGIVGTDKYVAPEVFNKLKYNGFKLDIWSIGIILYFIIFKKFPWKISKLEDENFKKFSDLGELNLFDLNNSLPIGIKNCLCNMISLKRWDINEVYNDDWIKKLSCCSIDGDCGQDHSDLIE